MLLTFYNFIGTGYSFNSVMLIYMFTIIYIYVNCTAVYTQCTVYKMSSRFTVNSCYKCVIIQTRPLV